MFFLITRLCPTLCNPVNCSQPGSSVHGIFQTRMLKWVAFSSSGGLSDLWNHQPAGSCHLNGRITRSLYLQKMTLLSNYHSSYSSGRNDHHQYEKVFKITGNAVLNFSSFLMQLSALQNERAERLLDHFLMIKDAACIAPYILLLVHWCSNEKTDTSLQEKCV